MGLNICTPIFFVAKQPIPMELMEETPASRNVAGAVPARGWKDAQTWQPTEKAVCAREIENLEHLRTCCSIVYKYDLSKMMFDSYVYVICSPYTLVN